MLVYAFIHILIIYMMCYCTISVKYTVMCDSIVGVTIINNYHSSIHCLPHLLQFVQTRLLVYAKLHSHHKSYTAKSNIYTTIYYLFNIPPDNKISNWKKGNSVNQLNINRCTKWTVNSQFFQSDEIEWFGKNRRQIEAIQFCIIASRF